MADAARSSVTVEIAGDEYTIRSDATPEHTRRCAELVDRTIREIGAQMSVDAHKVAILAALSLADQLFQARGEAESLEEQADGFARRLRERIEARLDGAALPGA